MVFFRGRAVSEVMDVIAAVNEIAVTNRSEFLDAVNTQTAGEFIPLDIIRIQQTEDAQSNEESPCM